MIALTPEQQQELIIPTIPDVSQSSTISVPPLMPLPMPIHHQQQQQQQRLDTPTIPSQGELSSQVIIPSSSSLLSFPHQIDESGAPNVFKKVASSAVRSGMT